MTPHDMLKTSSSHRYQRSKGVRAKHVVQLVMLAVILTWVSFQFKHSQRNKSIPTPRKAERSRDFLAEKSADWNWKVDSNVLGREGGNVDLVADKYQDQIDIEKKVADTGDASDKEDDEDNLEEKEDLQMDLTNDPAIGKEDNEEVETGRESLDEGDEDNDVADGNRSIGGNIATENDNSTEDFNEDIENREDIENALSDEDDEQTNSDAGAENDGNGSEFSQFQSEANKQEFTDFEGEESLKDRKSGESEHTENSRERAASDLKESSQSSPLSDQATDPAIRAAGHNRTAIIQTEILEKVDQYSTGYQGSSKNATELQKGREEKGEENLKLDSSRTKGPLSDSSFPDQKPGMKNTSELATVNRAIDVPEGLATADPGIYNRSETVLVATEQMPQGNYNQVSEDDHLLLPTKEHSSVQDFGNQSVAFGSHTSSGFSSQPPKGHAILDDPGHAKQVDLELITEQQNGATMKQRDVIQ